MTLIICLIVGVVLFMKAMEIAGELDNAKREKKLIKDIINSPEFNENPWIRAGSGWPPNTDYGPAVICDTSVLVLCETNDGSLYRGYYNRKIMSWVIILKPGLIHSLHPDNLKHWKYAPSFLNKPIEPAATP